MADRKRNVAYMRSLYVSSALSPETKTSLGQLDIPKGILGASPKPEEKGQILSE
jgi:hypothetical protein